MFISGYVFFISSRISLLKDFLSFKKKGLFDKPKKSDIYILDNDTCVQIVNSEKEVEKYKNYDKTVIVKV